MALATGSTLLHYEVLGPLGAGAMGEVYRARDTKLGREVAIKVLPEHFAADEERLRRFEREAKTLASLNHTNVAQIFGVDQVGDTCFLVLELVPGQTLEERLKQGPLSLDDTLAVCRQIASGLEAAHEAGVIHRDLKPANIRLTPDGKVKVLDFGLAKPAREGGGGSSTDSVLSTESGRLLGTPTYMAPEQARGKSIDKRVDIWAFGCVLYECLTGKRAFAGETLTDVLGAVLHTSPDLSRLPQATPPRVRELLADCLVKDPHERARDIGEIRRQLERARAEPALTHAGGNSRAWIGWAAAAIAAGSALYFALRSPAPAPLAPAFHFTLPQAETGHGNLVISPDGRYVVFTYEGSLWLRALADPAARELEGTAKANWPFWSPDSRQIAFFAGNKLKRVGLGGAPPEVLADVPGGWCVGSWSSRGTILIEVTEATENEGWFKLEPGQTSFQQIRRFPKDRPFEPDKCFPCFLPDGRHFLFTQPVGSEAMLQIGDVDSEETRALVPADSRAFYAAPGYILYVRRGILLAQGFDAAKLELRGDPVQLIDGIQSSSITGWAGFSVSQEGTLVFRHRSPDSRLQWFDREGRALESVLKPDDYREFDLSPDGQALVVGIVDPQTGGSDLWRVDLQRGMPTRLTSARRGEYCPRWSPDGKQLAMSADWNGPPSLYLWDIAQASARVLVPFDRRVQWLGGWSPDGKQVIYRHRDEATGSDIWCVDVASGERRKLLGTAFSESDPVFSPDGRSIAYASNESGRFEIYVQSLADASERQRVSLDGGHDTHWPGSGKEIFYSDDHDWLFSVELSAGADGQVLAAPPKRLFNAPSVIQDWAVSKDGQRFLLMLTDSKNPLQPDDVVVGWQRLLTR